MKLFPTSPTIWKSLGLLLLVVLPGGSLVLLALAARRSMQARGGSWRTLVKGAWTGLSTPLPRVSARRAHRLMHLHAH
jgi:hypothetical protein